MRMQDQKLVALVVTHNRLAQLQRTVMRLLESDPVHLRTVIVCDNASTDGTAEWLAGLADPRLEVLRLACNGGGAAGFEAGMRHAVAQHDPDWMVVMDDDGRPDPGALARFHALDLSGWDAVAAAVYTPDGAICDMNRPSRNPFWHRRVFLRSAVRLGRRDGFHLTPRDYASDRVQPIDITSFVGLFLSREGMARAGYPDGRLFLYGDDGLYTLGLRQAGGRIGFVPQIVFEHDCSTFQGRAFTPLWKVYYYHRNLLILYGRAAGWMRWPLLAVVVPKWLTRIRAHPGQRRAFLRLILCAIRDGLRGRVDVDHGRILAISGEKQARINGNSGYRGDSAPRGSAPTPALSAPRPPHRRRRDSLAYSSDRRPSA